MIIIKSDNLTGKDIFNMQSNSEAMKVLVGKQIRVDGYAVTETPGEDGQPEKINYILSDGVIYGGNSSVVTKCMYSLHDYVSSHPDEDIIVEFILFKTKGGRDALTMQIV